MCSCRPAYPLPRSIWLQAKKSSRGHRFSSTLVSGERDAGLVDTPITVEQARALANWVVARGKNLTTIYATHGHGDHFFGSSTVLEHCQKTCVGSDYESHALTI